MGGTGSGRAGKMGRPRNIDRALDELDTLIEDLGDVKARGEELEKLSSIQTRLTKVSDALYMFSLGGKQTCP